MTDLLPVEPDALAVEADPVAYMLVVLNRAKSWLVEAQNIETVREAKAIAVGYEAVIREKEMAADAQLAATEIVRRCEHRITRLVRDGQERGEILRRGQRADLAARADGGVQHNLPKRIADVVPETEWHGGGANPGIKDLDTSPEQFEQAIEEAKAEGNLSRANVVRKVKGEPAPKTERDPIHYRGRHIDPERVLRETSTTLDGLATALQAIDGLPLTEEATAWLNASSQSLQLVARRLNAVRRKGVA